MPKCYHFKKITWNGLQIIQLLRNLLYKTNKICEWNQKKKIVNNSDESKVLQYFGNMRHKSAAPDLLVRSWRWRKALDCETLSSPDTPRVLLAEFTSTACSIASEITVLGRTDLAWSSWTIWLLFVNSLVIHFEDIQASSIYLQRDDFYFLFFFVFVSLFNCISTFVCYLMPKPSLFGSVGQGWIIHQLFLCKGVRPLSTSVLDMTLSYLMVRFQ